MNRITRHICALVTTIFVASCSMTTGTERQRVSIQLKADGTINPDHTGRPSPIFIEIYQLKSLHEFNSSDYFELSDNYRQVLGSTLIDKTEISLQPNMETSTNIFHTLSTNQLGFILSFRDIDNSRWRYSVNLNGSTNCDITMLVDHLEADLTIENGDCDE